MGFAPEVLSVPRIEGELIDSLLGHRVVTVNVEEETHLGGLTGFVRAIKPQPVNMPSGKPVDALKYTHFVQFDQPWPDGRSGAWFLPTELEDLGAAVDGSA